MSSAKAFARRIKARLIMLATGSAPTPVYRSFGWAVGTPVDRVFIEQFLRAHSDAIAGRVLEVGDREYTTTFGGQKVVRSDVLSAVPTDDPQTIVADLTNAPQIPNDTYDCIVLTQTLHYVSDMPGAVSELHRILRPGGSLLVTVPGISQISAWDRDRWGDRWRLTDLSMRELLQTCFVADDIDVDTYGNAAAATALIQGIPAQLLSPRVFATSDDEYQVVVAGVARKRAR